METLNSSGKNSSSMNPSPWEILESGEKKWTEFSALEQDKLVRHFSNKIRIIALRMKAKLPQHVELGDLTSAGSLGLLDALRRFDPSLNIKFETYSESRIRGAMLDELRKQDWLSRGLRQRVKLIQKALKQLEFDSYDKIDSVQIAGMTGLSEKEVQEALEALQNQLCISLDLFDDNLNVASENQNDPYNTTEFNETVKNLAELMENLTQREQLVISLYYTEELSMKEVANVMEITEGRVSQLHSQALAKLQTLYSEKFVI